MDEAVVCMVDVPLLGLSGLRVFYCPRSQRLSKELSFTVAAQVFLDCVLPCFPCFGSWAWLSRPRVFRLSWVANEVVLRWCPCVVVDSGSVGVCYVGYCGGLEEYAASVDSNSVYF